MADAQSKLLILLGLKDEASPGLKKAGESAKGLGTELTNVARIAAGVATGSLGAQLGLSLSEHFKDAITEVQTFGNAVYQLQQRVGVSAGTASGLLSVFERFGASSEDAQRQLTFFSRGLRGQVDVSEAALLNGRSFAGTLAELGVSATDSAGNFRPLEQVLDDVQARMSQLKGDGETAARAVALFGRSGAALAPMLNLSAEEFRELQAEAKRLGVVLSQDDVDQVRQLARAHKDLDEATRGLTIQTGLLVTGPLTALAKVTADLATKFNMELVPAIKNAEREYQVWQKMAGKVPTPGGGGIDLSDPLGMRTAFWNLLKSGSDPLGMRTALWNLLPLSGAHNQAAAVLGGTSTGGRLGRIAQDEINAAKAEADAAKSRASTQANLDQAEFAGKHALEVVQHQINVRQRERLDLVKEAAAAELALIPIKQQQADLDIQLLQTQNQRAQIERETLTNRARLAGLPSSFALEDNQYRQQLAEARMQAGALAGQDISGDIRDLVAAKMAEPGLQVKALEAGRAVTLAERNQQVGQLRTDIATAPTREAQADLAIQAAQTQRQVDQIAAEQRAELLNKTEELVNLEQQRRDIEDKLFEIAQRGTALNNPTVNLTLTVNEAGGEPDYDKLAKDLSAMMVDALGRAQRTSGPGAPTTVPGGRLQQGAEG